MAQEKTLVADRGAAEPISLGAALLAGKKAPPDALSLLVLDHLEAMSFFERYALEADEEMKASVLLQVHMQVEEELVYPVAGQATGDAAMISHAEEEHEQARACIAAMDASRPGEPDFESAFQALKAAIQQHVSEEETSFFPRLRETDLDFYALGRAVAARRVELLFDRTRQTSRNEPMTLQTDMDTGTPRDVGVETQIDAITPDAARPLFVEGLRNIHGAKMQGRTMLKNQIARLENYPKLLARLEQNLTETEAQLERIEQILTQMGEGTSGLKDTAMSMMGQLGAMKNVVAGDEVLKNSFETAALVQFEISAYRSLLVLGEAAGETASLRILQQCLNEERSFASWLEENLAGTVITHLQLRSDGSQASH
jgi:ferritin-like metal-binding protein YciE